MYNIKQFLDNSHIYVEFNTIRIFAKTYNESNNSTVLKSLNSIPSNLRSKLSISISDDGAIKYFVNIKDVVDIVTVLTDAKANTALSSDELLQMFDVNCHGDMLFSDTVEDIDSDFKPSFSNGNIDTLDKAKEFVDIAFYEIDRRTRIASAIVSAVAPACEMLEKCKPNDITEPNEFGYTTSVFSDMLVKFFYNRLNLKATDENISNLINIALTSDVDVYQRSLANIFAVAKEFTLLYFEQTNPLGAQEVNVCNYEDNKELCNSAKTLLHSLYELCSIVSKE